MLISKSLHVFFSPIKHSRIYSPLHPKMYEYYLMWADHWITFLPAYFWELRHMNASLLFKSFFMTNCIFHVSYGTYSLSLQSSKNLDLLCNRHHSSLFTFPLHFIFSTHKLNNKTSIIDLITSPYSCSEIFHPESIRLLNTYCFTR